MIEHFYSTFHLQMIAAFTPGETETHDKISCQVKRSSSEIREKKD